MLQSTIFLPTQSAVPTEEISRNGKLLQQAGFVSKLQAGVYSWLPMGLRVLEKISKLIRREHQRIGAEELLMPALQPKALWSETGRWESLKSIMYQWQDKSGHDLGLATTHEEVIVDLLKKSALSYRDLPKALYQIQWKFRNEPRAKSGVIRGREFLMKDLYSFHVSAEDLDQYYAKVHQAYRNIYADIGLKAYLTEASGGTFTKRHSHEFQVISDAGEDKILVCPKCEYAQNLELGGNLKKCPNCGKTLETKKSIEVGNTFIFGDYYGQQMHLKFTDKQGTQQPVYVASYGIGITRLVGAVTEVYSDAKGLVWPKAIAPFQVQLLVLGNQPNLTKRARAFEKTCEKNHLDILLDDRNASPGFKLKDSELIGMPWRVVFSEKRGQKVELTNRQTGKAEILEEKDALAKLLKP
ncbi:hypothetical protein C4546_02710 [Candidatus Parcubacteria bacterium]|jgi:prolyl-tRNA synthetase|nr:MAG: hypothetical protein C4546_02710 [Candidatus Parcubacteria bacterium]